MLHNTRILSVCLVATLMLSGCTGGMHAQSAYDANGNMVRQDTELRKAVEVYEVAPRDMSYVNFEPDIDHEIVQNEDVEIYDLEPRHPKMSHSERVETQTKARWSTLISMWHGGLNIGSSLYDDEKKTYND